ncbi:MAG: nucleotidyltransferase domain-containing protein [Candidatus Sumerlaeota bacterium]|nr:nucleotidyltransferase domain-containing protein [Candidatus Sumerlaeota bacterium]
MTDGNLRQILEDITHRIVKRSQPARIILFGSAARGDMTSDSDVDLLVLMREVEDPRAEAVGIHENLVGVPVPVDVIVMSVERFEETRNVIGGIAYPASKYGRVIYEAA